MGNSGAARERRKSPRHRVRLVAAYSAAGETHLGVLRDLSAEGAFLQAPAGLPPGTEVRLGLVFPGAAGEVPAIEGRVVRVVEIAGREESGPLVGMGLELRPTPEQHRLLREALAAPGAVAVARIRTETRASVVPAARPTPRIPDEFPPSLRPTPVLPPPPVRESPVPEAGRDTPGRGGYGREVRPPALSGRFTLPGVADEAGRRRRAALGETPSLRLARMRPGQSRGLRLRLFEVQEERRSPTEFHLEVQITCDQPERLYYLDVRPDFGSQPPAAARLSVLKNRYDKTYPVPIVSEGAPILSAVAVEIDAGVERLVLWVATDDPVAGGRRYAAEIRVRPPSDRAPRTELDTLRLPHMKSVIKPSLVAAFRVSRVEGLVFLAEAMASEDRERKLALIDRLIRIGADVRWVEAAVRDVELAEQTVSGFPRLDFEGLCLDVLGHAAVAVFHPGTPAHLVNQVLAVASEFRRDEARPDDARWWDRLFRGATVVLHRRAPEQLEEDLAVLGLAEDGSPFEALREAAAWAARVELPAPPTAAGPLERYLRAISLDPPAAASKAAAEILTFYGFIGLSCRL